MKTTLSLSLIASTALLLSGCGGGGGSTGGGGGNSTTLKVSAGADRAAVTSSATRIVGTSNKSGTTYQWSEGGTDIPGATAATLLYTPATAGAHTLTLTATNGSDTVTDSVTLTAGSTAPTYRNLLVVRINFADTSFQNDAPTWSAKIFGSAGGQLNDYYGELSGGQFQFLPATESDGTQDGLIDVTLSPDHPADDSSDGSFRYWTVFKNALSQIDSQVDFSSYDINNNGSIDAQELQIMFLVSGGETSTGWNPNQSIWGLKSCYSAPTTPPAPTLDGVTLMACSTGGNFSRFGERHKAGTTDHDATIGIIAHELGHAAFGLPDLYDVDGATGGIGMFGLMGAGSWARASATQEAGETPVHMTAWSKIQAGFISPTIISGTTSATLHGTDTGSYNIYQVNTSTPGEYYLVENRPNSGYDKGLHALNNGSSFAGGLLVMHVDDAIPDNSGSPHRLVDVEEVASPELDNTSGSNRGAVGNLFYGSNTGTLSAPYGGGTTPTVTAVSASGDPMTATITP